MKKNLLLYVLLVFLIAVNGFFLFNHLGGQSKGKEIRRGPKGPGNFIAKELHFSDDQMAKFDELSRVHHKNMRATLEATKKLKDEVFKLVTNENVPDEAIDSLMNLIAEQEKAREKLTFYHLRDIQGICDEKQKRRFKKILSDALHKAAKGPRPDRKRPDHPPPPMH
ncbi:hypothetical protein [Seonamhaeicola sp.]|uniref:hypothetical protein n=1 Tax=Seonamhaeicola sp. TaxID=1912245 RepID=UPI0026352363|nr:hypothetical protein [Seonamhaeicola sp.]